MAVAEGLVPSQLGSKELTTAEAMAACGPAAAVAFARQTGRNPTLREAVDLAKTVGWTQAQGMAGPASQQRLLQQMGVPARLEQSVDWAKVRADVEGGNPVTISTPKHYFVATAYDPETDKFDFQASGEVLKGGSRWLRPADVARLGNGVQGALYLDNPEEGTEPSLARSAPAAGAPTGAPTGPVDLSSREAFARTAGPYAKQIEAETGIPASVMLGIAINEGALAKGTVASQYNNVMGIKATGDWQGQTTPKMSVWEVEGGHDVRRPATFRAYDSPVESFRDFAAFLQENPRYGEALKHTADPTRFVQELKKAGYATDPNWPGKVLRLANSVAGAVGETTAMEPRSTGSPGAAAEYEKRAKADIDRTAAGLEELRDPQWRADFIARLQHDRGFRENALVKGRKPGDLERTLAQLEEETESPVEATRAAAWRDIERSYDLAAQAAEAELTKEETRRETVYSRAKDDYKAALGGAGREEVQALDIQLKIAQLDKALNPPGPQRTPEQRARDIAAARRDLQQVEVGIPAQADRDRAAAQQAAAQTAKIQRDLIPTQQLVLQEGWQTIARIKDELATGRITPQEADQYYTSVQQYVTSGLRGSTPAAEDKLRIQEATKRAQIGKDLLNQQVQSGTALAGNLNRDYQQLLAKTLEPPGEYDPLQRASLFTAGMGGGLQNPSTLDISGQLIGALGGATPTGMPQTTGAPGVNWAEQYPGVPLASAVPAGAAALGGEEEIPEDAEMSAEDYSRILAEVFTEEEDYGAEDEEESEE